MEQKIKGSIIHKKVIETIIITFESVENQWVGHPVKLIWGIKYILKLELE